jgi:hypothetical protein
MVDQSAVACSLLGTGCLPFHFKLVAVVGKRVSVTFLRIDASCVLVTTYSVLLCEKLTPTLGKPFVCDYVFP